MAPPIYFSFQIYLILSVMSVAVILLFISAEGNREARVKTFVYHFLCSVL